MVQTWRRFEATGARGGGGAQPVGEADKLPIDLGSHLMDCGVAFLHRRTLGRTGKAGVVRPVEVEQGEEFLFVLHTACLVEENSQMLRPQAQETSPLRIPPRKAVGPVNDCHPCQS